MKYLFILGWVGVAACHSNRQPAPAAPAMAAPTVRIFKPAEIDSKKDPVCGMPSSAGIEDTLHIKGKVVGFCSKECKAEYVKAPAQYTIEYK